MRRGTPTDFEAHPLPPFQSVPAGTPLTDTGTPRSTSTRRNHRPVDRSSRSADDVERAAFDVEHNIGGVGFEQVCSSVPRHHDDSVAREPYRRSAVLSRFGSAGTNASRYEPGVARDDLDSFERKPSHLSRQHGVSGRIFAMVKKIERKKRNITILL